MANARMQFGWYDGAAFLSMVVYALGSVIVPVALVAVARDLGFSLEGGGMGRGGALQLARSVPMVATMLLCGFAAGRWGKRRSLGAAILVLGVGIAGAALSPAYGALFLAVMVAGLGEGVVEGLLTPFVQDLHADAPGRYINFSHSFWSVGVVLATAGGGTLLCWGVSWRAVMLGVGLLAAAPAFLLLTRGRNVAPYPERSRPVAGAVVWQRAARVMRQPLFWLYFGAMVLAGGGEYCLTFWVASLIQLDFAGSAFVAGLGTAVFALGMMAGRMWFGCRVPQGRLPHLVMAMAALGVASGAFFPGVDSLPFLFALLLPLGIATAPFWPSIQSHCEARLQSRRVDSTMLFVLLSCAGVPGCGFFAFFMGWLGDRVGLRASFWLVPLCYAVMGALVAADWLAARRGRQVREER